VPKLGERAEHPSANLASARSLSESLQLAAIIKKDRGSLLIRFDGADANETAKTYRLLCELQNGYAAPRK
jgi:hypothetical protein